MKIFRILLLLCMIFTCKLKAANEITNKRLYKRLEMPFNLWKKFIHTTPDYYVDTTIECGAACNAHWAQCDLFVFQENQKRCHVGLADQNNNYLTGLSGNWPVHLSIDKLVSDLENTYLELTYVKEEVYWEKFIYRTFDLDSPGDFLDCGFICRNVLAVCSIFAMEGGTCYIGKPQHRGDGIGKTIENATVFSTSDSMTKMKDDQTFRYKDGVAAHNWIAHLVESHSDAIQKQVQCEAIAVIELWHYSVYDSVKNTCYFGLIRLESFLNMIPAEELPAELPPAEGSSTSTTAAPPPMEFTPLEVDDTTSRQVQINIAELKEFFISDFTSTRSTKLYQQFTYAEFYLGETSDELCAMHCAMDTDNRCDFFYFRSHYCYLGSFNQVGGIGVHYCCDQITIRMNKNFVNDMMDTLYYTGVDIQNNRWSARIREKFETVNDYECGGHAALADNNIDYWIWVDGYCYLGDIPHGSDVYVDDAIKDHVNLNRGNSWPHLDGIFDEKFTLSGQAWNKYIFDTYPLEDQQDQTECGFRCEFSGDTCNFFTVSSGNCHLGRYDYFDQGTVDDTSGPPMTYHRSGTVPFIRNDNFKSFSSGNKWYKWTYKYEYRGDLWKCPFECYHDDDCDFYVDVHSYCCYGKWSQDVNSYVVSWSNDVTLYVKNGRSPGDNMITDLFNDAYGKSTQTNSVTRHWGYGIWGHYSDVETEAVCAFRCYILPDTTCSFYFWGNSHCQLGRYTHRGHNIYGSYDENTKYKIRKDYNFASQISSSSGGTNDGACKNYGYRTLTCNGCYVDISSGGHNYWLNERCYWGIWAPGARILRFQLTNTMDVYNTGDWMQVFLGPNTGSQHVLTLYDHAAYHWDFESEMMHVRWHTDNAYWHRYIWDELKEEHVYTHTDYSVAWGFTARITRYN